MSTPATTRSVDWAKAARRVQQTHLRPAHNATVPASTLGTSQAPLLQQQDEVLGQRLTVIAVSKNSWLLSNGKQAELAVSCLLQAQVGDEVLVTHAPVLILAILKRRGGKTARLSVPGAAEIRFQQAKISLQATESLTLVSLKNAELTAATGTLKLAARNLFTTVIDTLIERAADKLCKVSSYSLNASSLLRFRSRHGIITADEQIRIDAEQIHLG